MPSTKDIGTGVKARLLRTARERAGYYSMSWNIGRRWSKPEDQPAAPEPLEGVRLNAIVATWNEEDIVASTVSNVLTQGCERVLLIDNDSTDSTVTEALGAGAEVGRVYQTEGYDEWRRMAEIRETIEETSRNMGDDHVWWLICDADELPHGPGGRTIGDYVRELDRRFRLVGARVFDHYPSGEPANVPGRHPLDYQPLCQEVRMAWCSLEHWKHPLIRWDRNGPPLWPGRGFHRTEAHPERVREPTTPLLLHHVQYRDRAITTARLRLLCEGPGARANLNEALQGKPTGARRRLAMIDSVYEGVWDKVERPAVGGWAMGVTPRPWVDLVSPVDAQVRRWYSAEDGPSA